MNIDKVNEMNIDKIVCLMKEQLILKGKIDLVTEQINALLINYKSAKDDDLTFIYEHSLGVKK